MLASSSAPGSVAFSSSESSAGGSAGAGAQVQPGQAALEDLALGPHQPQLAALARVRFLLQQRRRLAQIRAHTGSAPAAAGGHPPASASSVRFRLEKIQSNTQAARSSCASRTTPRTEM